MSDMQNRDPQQHDWYHIIGAVLLFILLSPAPEYLADMLTPEETARGETPTEPIVRRHECDGYWTLEDICARTRDTVTVVRIR